MKINNLNVESDGARSVVIEVNQISYRALLRLIRRIPGVDVESATYDPMNDNTQIVVGYKGVIISIETPFSDYIINCSHPGCMFDDFVAVLADHKVRWWERYL